MNDIDKIEELQQYVSTHLFSYSKILLAFSGGLDSTVLLDILSILRNVNFLTNLRAVYVHHGLSDAAGDWLQHCIKECKNRNIDFDVQYIYVDKKKYGFEASARYTRYKTLTNMLVENEALCTAHHQDDQIETFLLALKRGSGPTGLSGMKIRTSCYGHDLIRPLLKYSRLELEFYAKKRKLFWIEDDSNTNVKFDRNFLRLSIIPILKKRWPNFSISVIRSMDICYKQEKLLDELLIETLNQCIHQDGSLYCSNLINMSDIKRNIIIRHWLSRYQNYMPSQKQLLYLWSSIILSRRDSVAKIIIGSHQIQRFKNRLYVLPKIVNFSNLFKILIWPKNKEWLILPGNFGIILRFSVIIQNMKHNQCSIVTLKINDIEISIQKNKIIHNILPLGSIIFTHINKLYTIPFTSITVVRSPLHTEIVSIRFGGIIHDRLYIKGRIHGRKLKKIWQELSVPPWQRNNIPLLFYNDQCIAALGIFVTHEGILDNFTSKWYILWNPESHIKYFN